MPTTRIKRRHPVDGGYARGEETRARIIATALQVFGEEGFNKASTRRIAADAGVNPPALQYYFNGKEGLHSACAQFIIDRVMVVLGPAMTAAQQIARHPQREPAIEAVCALLDAMADGLVAAGSESWSRFITRGKADGAGPAMGMLRQNISHPLMRILAQLIAIVTNADPADDVVRIRAAAILGQVSTFLTNREATLEALHWTEFNQGRLQIIKTVVREHTRAVLLQAKVGSGKRRVTKRAGSSRIRRK
ncbi:MAG TPA: CerR family C-terminal domain-containing protein [Candidatus Acidoferrum sp.]|nr:CerR family C-terminal domain-containing protein [Candidatus Acidoferrum sp.]